MKNTRLTKHVAFILSLLLMITCLPIGAQAYSVKIEFAPSEITAEPTYSAPDEVYAPPVTNDVTFYTVTEQTPFVIADDISYTDDLSEVTAALREGMKARQSTITVHYHTTSASFGGTEADATNLITQIFNDALAHTGVPTEGDSLRWVYKRAANSISGTIIGSHYYFDITFNVTYYTTAQQEAALTQAVNTLISDLSLHGDVSDYEKICRIYNYMTENIRYDYSHLSDPNYTLQYTAYAALVNKTSVCQGYATLFYRLALEVGIDTRIITGLAGTSELDYHSWNIVKLNNKYYLLDATWDEGTYEYSWFLKSYDDFPYHYEDTAYTYPLADSSYVHQEDTEGSEGDFEYTVSNGTATITKYTGSAKNVVVPATIGGYPVVSIVSHTFYCNQDVEVITISEGIRNFAGGEVIFECTSLHTLNLPSTLQLGTFDGEGANSGISPVPVNCYKLRTITVPASNTNLTVYQGALYNKSMTTLLLLPPAYPVEKFVVPDGVQYIGSDSCRDNLFLKEVVLPDSVVNIGYWVFKNSYYLENVNIPKNCTFIGQYTFGGTSISSVHIPAATEVIVSGAFSDTESLKEITVDPKNTSYYSVDGVLYAYADEGSVLCCYPSQSTRTEFTIPDGVFYIDWYAFGDVRKLCKLVIPASVKHLGVSAFFDMNSGEYGVHDCEIIFLGDAPVFEDEYVFANCHATVYYPKNNSTWTAAVRQSYAGHITWVCGEPSVSTGWVQEGNNMHYYENGVMCVSKWISYNNSWYYVNAKGNMVTDWQQIGGKWYYMDSNGIMQTGWQKIDGKWYYLKSEMKTGWQQIGGKWYYLKSEMKTGWQQIDGKWYYLGFDGAMRTGWQKIDGKWYYLKSDMKTGWQQIDGKWYYLKSEMKTGWQQIGGKWYYLGADGAMKTGWQKISNKWYYMNSSGVMVTGTQVIGGKTYTFNSNGVWVQN